MSNRRYHIHVICVAHSQPLILDSLAVFFQSRAFLTYDVSTVLPQSALYGRQCVDACDYVLIVIGDSYGTSPNLVVSQMHLSYLSAKSKSKPIMTLVKRQYDSLEASRQLQDFTRMVERQTSHVYYYDDNTDIKQLLSSAYTGMVTSNELPIGWLKAHDDASVQSRTVSTKQPVDKSGSFIKTAVEDRVFSRNNSASYDAKNYNANHYNSDSYVATDNLTKIIKLTETFDIEYNAQAYEGGNLTDVTLTMTLSWEDMLLALGNMPTVFSSYGLQSHLNRLIASKAEAEIKQLMSNVHAVARCQIVKRHLDKLQRILIAANWIEIKASGSDLRETKELWSLTYYAKTLFESNEMIIADR